jgi:hypothetical protein
MCEVRRTADSRQGESGAKPGAEQSIAATGASFSGWRRNVRKHKLVNQGYLSGCRRSRAGVRVLIVAMKRVMTVERRRAGRWKREGKTTANQTAGSASG